MTRQTSGVAADAVMAARHALTLGSSLMMGLAIGMVVRLFVPRALGPDAFGELRFAESAAEMIFVILSLGVDSVIRREVAVFPNRVKNYIWGLTLLRIAGGLGLIGVTAGVLHAFGSNPHRVVLFGVIAAAQLLVVLNNSFAAVEQASGDVRWIAKANIAFKLLWAGLAVGVIVAIPSSLGLALALLTSETMRFTGFTLRMARRHPLVQRPDFRLATAAIVVSVPYFINTLAYSFYGRVGTWWLSAAASDREVGWYGAASNLSSVALLGMPILSWVLVPAAARVGQRSHADVDPLVGGALRMVLLLSVPISVALALAAPFLMSTLFGAAFAPGAAALRLLAPTVVLAYVSTICAIGLIQSQRIREVAAISIGGLVLSIALNGLLIPHGAASGTVGGAAAGAALATLLTEIVVTAAMLRLGWSRTWNAPLLQTGLGLGLGAASAILISFTLPATGALSAIACVAAFCIVAALTRAVGAPDLAFCRRVLQRSKPYAPITV